MRLRSGRLTPITTDPYTQPAVAIPWPATTEGPAPVARATERVLVAGVGYRNLRDMSTGPEIVDRLRAHEWPRGVQVEDLSFGAIHVLHWLQEQPAFDAAVIVGSVVRGRAPGTVARTVWCAPELPGEAIQGAIAEAVTGVLGVDTLLTVLGYFGALPARVIVVEIEPRDEDWGPDFSPLVESALSEACALVHAEISALLA